MAIGSTYSILLSLQFDKRFDSLSDKNNTAMSITDLYTFNRIYIGIPEESENEENYSLLGITTNGNVTEILNMKDIPVVEEKQYKILKEVLKEINTFVNNIIIQRSSSSASSKTTSYILKLDDDWLNKKLNS